MFLALLALTIGPLNLPPAPMLSRAEKLVRAARVLRAWRASEAGRYANRKGVESALGPPGDYSTRNPVYKGDGPAITSHQYPIVLVWNTDEGRVIIPFHADGSWAGESSFQIPVSVSPPP